MLKIVNKFLSLFKLKVKLYDKKTNIARKLLLTGVLSKENNIETIKIDARNTMIDSEDGDYHWRRKIKDYWLSNKWF